MRMYLLQILSKKVFFWIKTFWIAETPSTIVRNRFNVLIDVIVLNLIVVNLLKYSIHNSASKEELTSMRLWLGSQYPGWPTLAFRSHVAHQPLLSLGCKCLVMTQKCRAATGVLLNMDHTLTEWPNMDRFLFFQLFLLLLKISLLIQLKGKLQEFCKVW